MYGCRWNWCRQTFTRPSELKKHVIAQHVNRTVPVRRRELSMLRRVHEGVGESLSLPIVSSFGSETGPSPQKLYSQEASQAKDLPPSPPVSSPAQSPVSHPKSLQDECIVEPADLCPHIVPLQQEISPRSPSPSPPQSPISFGRLSSAHGSPAPLANPGSPSFDSLIERKNSFGPMTSTSSSPDKSSNSSQMSVEQQLTQSLGRNDYSDESRSSSRPSSPTRAESKLLSPLQADNSSANDLYTAELSWDASQASEPQEQPSTRKVATLHKLSQPPSQFQAPLIHSHRSHSTQDPSQPLGTPTASLLSPAFAVSTPPLQNWYQPSSSILKSLHRRASQTSQPPTPSQPQGFRSGKLQATRKSTTFRDGTPKRVRTLEHNSEKMTPSMEVDGDEYSRSQSQPQSYPTDESFDEFQSNSYPPLQTQGPYNSQF